MRALYYPAFDQLTQLNLPAPTPADGEVLLQVSACGICGSELESFRHHSLRRPPPLIMGHEFCGTVVDSGHHGRRFSQGTRVVSNSLVSCRTCVNCRRGDEHLCRNRQLFGMHRPGAFAEYVCVPEHCLFTIPETLKPEAACLTEPLANGVHMVRLTTDLSPRRVLVIGAGPIGLLAQQAFRAMTGAQVFTSDPNPRRLAAAAAVGATRTIDPLKEDVVAMTRELSGGEGADVVIDAVGSEQTKRQSLQAVRAGGAVVWIGLAQDEIKLPSLGVTLAEIRIHGTYAARPTDMSKAIELLARGAVATETWVTLAPLQEGAELFRRMLVAQDADIKGIIVP